MLYLELRISLCKGKKKIRFWISFWSIEHVRAQYSVDALPNCALSCCSDYRGFGLVRFEVARVYCSRICCGTAVTESGRGQCPGMGPLEKDFSILTYMKTTLEF